MSQFLSKIGFTPLWGSVSRIKAFIASHRFDRRLSEIHKKKMENPSLDVSGEIKDLLKEPTDPDPK